MSLPIPTTTLILGATKLAHGVANRVGQVIGFDEVLRGADSAQASGVTKDVGTMTNELSHSIRSQLRQSGVHLSGDGPNQSLRISVEPGGDLTVRGDHSRAAEIEALLGANPQITHQARQLAMAGGPSEISIDLTSNTKQANMMELFGG